LGGGFSGEIALRRRAQHGGATAKNGQIVTDLPWNGSCVTAAAWTVLSSDRGYLFCASTRDAEYRPPVVLNH
jgi:hypothetical protein